MINERSSKSDMEDEILANAEFILNSRLGFVNGCYPSLKDNEYEYTYRVRFLSTRVGDHVVMYDVDTGLLRAMSYELLCNENFDLIDWWLK